MEVFPCTEDKGRFTQSEREFERSYAEWRWCAITLVGLRGISIHRLAMGRSAGRERAVSLISNRIALIAEEPRLLLASRQALVVLATDHRSPRARFEVVPCQVRCCSTSVGPNFNRRIISATARQPKF